MRRAHPKSAKVHEMREHPRILRSRLTRKLVMPSKFCQHAIAVFTLIILSLYGCAFAQAPSTSDQDQQVPALDPAQPIERVLKGGETHLYTLKLNAGQFFEVCVERVGMVMDVAVFSPSGQRVAEGDGAWESNECDLVNQVAAEDGNYRIEVRLFFPKARGGRYRIKLVAQRPPTESDRHRVLGNKIFADAHRRRFRWSQESQQVIAEFMEALKHWQSAGDKMRETMTYSSIAQVYRGLGDLPKSTEYFEKTLAIARAEGFQALEVNALADLGYTYAKQGQVLRGVVLTKDALNLSRTTGDQIGQCRALVLLGGISNAAGNVRAGQEYNREALPFCRAAPSPLGERFALTQIADSFIYLGEPQQALAYFNQALEIVTPAFDAYAQGYIRLNLARLRLQTGELQEALAQAQRALEIYRQIGLRDAEGNTRLILGRIYKALGDDEQAYNSFNQAFNLSVATSDQYLKAFSLRDLTGISIKLGRRAEAEKYLEQAAGAFREKSLPSGDVEAFKQLGNLELIRGTPAAAVDYFKQALALSQKQELAAHEAETLWLLGTSYLTLGQREQAAESFRQALTTAKEKRLPDYEIQALGGLARLAQERGDDHEAQMLLENALNLIETSRARIASPDFRITFFSATREFYERYIEALMNQHEQRRARGDDHFAAQALHAVERARARSLLELLAEARADIQQGVDPELLNRERELQQRLSAKAERLWLLGQSGKNREQAAAIKAEIDALTFEQRDLAAQIRIRSPRYAALRQPQPLTLPEIQKQVLDSDTLLLEYAFGEKRSFLFAVTPDEIKSFVLPGRSEIEQEARRMLPLLEDAGKPQSFKSLDEKRIRERRLAQEYLKASTTLGRMLLAPVENLLGKKRLLIVSDGMLHYLPFAALPEPVTVDSSLRDAKSNRTPGSRREAQSANSQPLVVNHEIVNLPSASTLAVLRRELEGREAAQKTVAVLADPVFGKEDERLDGQSGADSRTAPADGAQPSTGNAISRGEIAEDLFRLVDEDAAGDFLVPRLPGTRREAEAILALVPGTQRKAALDFDASRATATGGDLGQYRYLHFATHGLLNSAHPELSGLVLSLVDKQGNPQNGVLRALDVYNLKLPVELVVLSGCRTALGKESSGEGLMGLTRGFLYAGARRVIASLWKVNDRATAELMRRFYQEMLSEKQLPPAAALRAAQVSMWRDQKWRAPYYWAAFVLQGEW